ncbi:MAG: RNA 3'-terminal phosphate cyclase [Myxococcota bacterium]
MLEIDGSQQSGSGTIVRFAVAFSALCGEPIHLVSARVRRARPGLRPQHVAAVRACAALCEAETEGVEVGSRELRFRPRGKVSGGTHTFDIGSAGSATMLTLGVLPLACLATAPFAARIVGGVFQDFAPSPFHVQHVLAPLLARMGGAVSLELVRPGYVPVGGGELALRVEPAAGGLRAIELPEPGPTREVRGIALASHLAERHVAERMARTCEARLADHGLRCTIERVDDSSASRPGAGLAVWAETEAGCRLGADRAGAPRRSSEAIGRYVARTLLADLASGASVDRHLADQLVLFAALAKGTTRYRVPEESVHLRTNLWLAERFGARARCDARTVEVTGLGLLPGAAPR